MTGCIFCAPSALRQGQVFKPQRHPPPRPLESRVPPPPPPPRGGIIVTHPTTFVHCFRVLFFSSSGTHCKGVSKQLCVYHLYRNVFLAQTRIRSHLGCIFPFRKLVSRPTIKSRFETRFEMPFSSCRVYHRSLSIASMARQECFVTAELHCAISPETQCI